MTVIIVQYTAISDKNDLVYKVMVQQDFYKLQQNEEDKKKYSIVRWDSVPIVIHLISNIA